MKYPRKLYQKGFSHHLILPILAIIAVGSIGVYLTFSSRASFVACPVNNNWEPITAQYWDCYRIPSVSSLPPQPNCPTGQYPVAVGSEWRCANQSKPTCPTGYYYDYHYIGNGLVGDLTCRAPSGGGGNPGGGTGGGSTGGGTGGGTGGSTTPPTINKTCNPHVTIQRGSTGGCVAHAQDLLTKSGFSTSVDGSFGAGTEASVKAFEKKFGMTQNGTLDSSGWYWLHAASTGTQPAHYLNDHDKAYGCSTPRPTLQLGSKHNCVKYLQWTLNHDLHLDLARDGSFGSATKDAVLQFQKRYAWSGTRQDGVVGSSTWALVDRMVQDFNNEVDRVYNCPEPRPTLYYGDSGGSKANCIKYLQRSLNEIVGTAVARDGAYGPATKEAVLKMKAKYPEMPPGEVFSAHSWEKLDSLMRAKFPRP
jgi:peptidoglycan hydrolase-like protein with peptidoglycan-binding domain